MEREKAGPTTFQLKGKERTRVLELRHKMEDEIGCLISIAEIIRAAINEKYDREIGKEAPK